ncbi:Protein CBG14301 [Caenorhabditis briggsae]|uniref:Protein CBG14301 n=1 Tax=Caenorhabditis briggsae TaxID=6238 RepID=A8XJQ2_CAEBR|nr:Protein CBG14301 [Caenorhabditis briggsae]CAP32878.2 Protein CBG14301 [Caenorhabditis briggsae]
MHCAIKTEPSDVDVPSPIQQFLVKQESTDSFSIPENRVKQEPNDDTLESKISDRMAKNESFQEPIQSLVYKTAQPEEHISTRNVCMQYQTLSNMVMPPFNGFFPTQVSEQTIKQESISEHLQLTEDERDAQEDNVRMDMYRNFETNPNYQYSQPPIMKLGIEKVLVDDSYSFSIPENTVKQEAIDKRLESKVCEEMVENESFREPLRSFMSDTARNEDHFLPGNAYMQLQSQNNLANPSFNKLFPTQIPELTTKIQSTSEKRHEKNNEDDNVVEEWDASTELDELPTSDNINSKEATVSHKAFTGSTREHFLQWSSDCDNLLMDEFLKCIRETKQFDLNHIAEEFLKNHKVDVSLNTVKTCFKQVFLKRLTDPNVPEEEKIEMQRATKRMNMTKKFEEAASNNKPPSRRISNRSVGYEWSNSWDEKIMDEFMKLVMNGSSQLFSVNKFCAKFKAEHNLAIPVSRLKKNFNTLFDERLKDVNVELEIKLKMLLEYKMKVPLELTEQFASLGNILYSNTGSITSYLPSTSPSMLQELGFIPMDVSSSSQHKVVAHNAFMTNATSTTSKTANRSTIQRNVSTSESYEWNNSWDTKMINEFMKLATDGSSKSCCLKKFCEKFKTEHNLAITISRLVRKFKHIFDERLRDATVELESKLKMLLKYKIKVPLELTEKFASLEKKYRNSKKYEFFSQELGFIPMDVSSSSQHTVVPHNDFMTNSTSTTSETVQQKSFEYSKTQSSTGPVRREEHRHT